jgi:hypothetical protein
MLCVTAERYYARFVFNMIVISERSYIYFPAIEQITYVDGKKRRKKYQSK